MTDRVAIVGSRAHPNLDLVRAYVRTLPPDTVVISGGAEGVDSVAVEEALACGLTCTVVQPGAESGHVEVLGHSRTPNRMGIIAPVRRSRLVRMDASRRDLLLFRNTWLVVLTDRLVAFPDGSKGGTWDSVREAKRFRRPCEIRYADGRVVQGHRGVPARRGHR